MGWSSCVSPTLPRVMGVLRRVSPSPPRGGGGRPKGTTRSAGLSLEQPPGGFGAKLGAPHPAGLGESSQGAGGAATGTPPSGCPPPHFQSIRAWGARASQEQDLGAAALPEAAPQPPTSWLAELPPPAPLGHTETSGMLGSAHRSPDTSGAPWRRYHLGAPVKGASPALPKHSVSWGKRDGITVHL